VSRKRKGEKIYLREGKFEFPVFGYTVHFVETDNFLLAAQHLKLSTPALRDVTDAMAWMSKKGDEAYIFIDQKHQPIGTIVHECWHVINHMLTFRGVELNDDENVAYHLDFLVEKAMKFYKKEK
jgi:hypothetical protein